MRCEYARIILTAQPWASTQRLGVSASTYPSTRLADGLYRTFATLRCPSLTHQRSQLHDRLVELPCSFSVLRDEHRGQPPEFRVPHSAFHVPESAPQHPGDVGIDCWHRLLVGERGNGASRVWTNARELDQLFRYVRQLATVVPTDYARERVEIRSPGIVAEAIPSLSYCAGPRARQRFEIRETFQEPRIVLRHAGDLRLLQHELGDEHAVRIAGAAPRQIARGAGPPGEQAAGEAHFLR